MDAYLTGEGDLDRFVTPSTQVRAPRPPPATTAEIRTVAVAGSGDRRLVRLRVAARDQAGVARLEGYTVRLVARDGRWEVAELLPVAPLDDEEGR